MNPGALLYTFTKNAIKSPLLSAFVSNFSTVWNSLSLTIIIEFENN